MKRLAALALLLPVAGCMKLDEQILILPDGSGKIVYMFAMNPDLASMGGEAAKDPYDEMMSSDPEEFEKNAGGIVAMARPERVEMGGWKGVKITFYFEDVNKLQLGDSGKTRFSLKKEGADFVFEVVDKQFDSGEKPDETNEEMKKQMEEMFKKMMGGFDYKAAVRMPGKVKKAEGYTKTDGRTASLHVMEKDVQNQQDFGKKLGSRKATCGPSEVSEAEAAAFKEELAKAKKEWVALREEMKRNAEKKKGEEKKPEEKKPMDNP